MRSRLALLPAAARGRWNSFQAKEPRRRLRQRARRRPKRCCSPSLAPARSSPAVWLAGDLRAELARERRRARRRRRIWMAARREATGRGHGNCYRVRARRSSASPSQRFLSWASCFRLLGSRKREPEREPERQQHPPRCAHSFPPCASRRRRRDGFDFRLRAPRETRQASEGASNRESIVYRRGLVNGRVFLAVRRHCCRRRRTGEPTPSDGLGGKLFGQVDWHQLWCCLRGCSCFR